MREEYGMLREDESDNQQFEACSHPKEQTITYETNSASGCGAPADRKITHCYGCRTIINVIDS